MNFPFSRRRPRLVVHIGTHKTGTTSIQQAFRDHRDALLSAGVCYPDPGREPHPNLPAHNFIYRATLNGPAAMAAERDRIAQEFKASGARTLLLSEEGLCLPRPEVQEFFRPWVEQFDITFVCYLRRQDRYAESLYSQYVRENHVLARQTIEDFVFCPEIWARFDYPANLALWEGMGRMVAVNYDTQARAGSLHTPLLEAAGVKRGVAIAPGERSNVSPPAAAIEVIRQLNLRDIEHARPQLLTLMHDSADPAAPRGHLMGARLRGQFLDRVAGINRVLAERWGVRFDAARPEEPDDPLRPEIADTLLRALALATLRLKALREARKGAPPDEG